MRHVTVEDLKDLVQWLTTKQQYCIQRARQEFDKGNTEASNEFLSSAGAYTVPIDRLQVLIDKELQTP